MFWTVLKADLLFGLCSVVVSILVTLCVAAWRKRRLKKLDPGLKPLGGPRAILIGGVHPKPAHCPLCGQGWPLPGPVVAPEAPSEK